jgi:uncharacterized protein (TIGR00730 family)
MHEMSQGARPLICVFAGAHTPKDRRILKAARAVGKALGEEGFDVLYGGGSRGVMGEVTNAAHAAGAKVKAVLLERFAGDKEATPAEIVAVHETEFQRFPAFAGQRPVAYVVLPGGSGTSREAWQGIEMAMYDDGPPVILVKVGKYNKGIKKDFRRDIKAGLIDAWHRNVLQEVKPGQPLGPALKKCKKRPAERQPAL